MPPEADPNATPKVELPKAEHDRLLKLITDQEAMIGRQSTEVGALRKETERLKAAHPGTQPGTGESTNGQPGAGQAAGAGTPAGAAPEPATRSEVEEVERRWKALDDDTKATIISAAPGATRQAKIQAVQGKMLEAVRTNFVAVPESLFAAPEPAADPGSSQKAQELFTDTVFNAVLGADRRRHRIPTAGGPGSSGAGGSGADMSGFTARPGTVEREPARGDGGVLDLVAANRRIKPTI